MKSIHFSTMLAAFVNIDNTITNCNPNERYTNVTRFNELAVKDFCRKNKNYEPLRIASYSEIGDFIALAKNTK